MKSSVFHARCVFLCLCALLAGAARAQVFQDSLVQPPQLAAPERGSLAGQYSRIAFGPADLGRGAFSLAAPFSVPTDRGPLLASPFPQYSVDGGLSEWGMGWQATLALMRWRDTGSLDFATDALTGPWGRMQRGTDGHWYPVGLTSAVRVEEAGTELVAFLPDGSRWTFGGDARVQTPRGTYAWFPREVLTATGRRTSLTYQGNASGRLFVDTVTYGGTGANPQYRVVLQYEATPTPFSDYRAGVPLVLDQRVKTVSVQARHAGTGLFQERWRYDLTYTQDELGPAFYLSEVVRTFASGESEPPVRYVHEQPKVALVAATFRHVSKLDPLVQTIRPDILQAHRSSALDADDDGRMDLEVPTDYSLYVQEGSQFRVEPLGPLPANASPLCRNATSSSTNPLRLLARLHPGEDAVRVVRLVGQNFYSETVLTVCDREGSVVGTQTLTGNWELGAKTRLVDLDRDQRPDVLRVSTGQYHVLPNESDATGYRFGTARTGMLSPVSTPSLIWVHDMNGDGLPDIISRQKTGLYVWLNKGNLEFEQNGQLFQLRDSGVLLTDISKYELSFVDANRDGLTDVLLTWNGNVSLYVNSGKDISCTSAMCRQMTRLPIVALLGSATSTRPVVGDFAGDGNTEVVIVRNSQAEALALDGPATGLMRSADDGKGTVLRFEYGRGPAVPGGGARQAVLSALTIESSGRDPVRYDYAYGQPRRHSAGKFLLGFGTVTRQDALTEQTVELLHADAYTGVVLGGTQADFYAPEVRSFETREYDDAVFQGIPWKRPRATVVGWKSEDGTQTVSDRTDILAYTADVCPTRVRRTTRHGQLLTEVTRATPAGLAPYLHCLDAGTVLTGTHTDDTLDFLYASRVTRNPVGQVERVESLGDGGDVLRLQDAVYNPDATLASLSSPGRGVATFAYDAVTGLLNQGTLPDGQTVRVVERDPVMDGVLSLEMLGRGQPYARFFRFDGQERLSRQWTSLGGSDTQPLGTYAYQFATALQPGRVSASSLVDSGSDTRREGMELFTASGETVATGHRTAEGWVLGGVVERVASQALARTWLRAPLPSTTDLSGLTYASLQQGSTLLEQSRGSSFGHSAEAQQRFHSDVERSVATSLQLEAGGLVRTALENGIDSRRMELDVEQKVMAFENEALTRYTYRYDALGRLREVLLPDGAHHRVSFDDHGRTSRLEREGVATITYSYDPSSGLLSRKRFLSPAGVSQREVVFTHDGIGRLSMESHTDVTGGAQTYRYYRDGATPDSPTTSTEKGVLSAVEGEGYQKLYVYRADGKLERATLRLLGWRTVETSLTWFDDGSPRGQTTVVRGAQGQVLSSSTKSSVVDGHGRVTGVWVDGQEFVRYAYSPNGQLSAAWFATGEWVSLEYDSTTRRFVGLTQAATGFSAASGLRLNSKGLVARETLGVNLLNLTREYAYAPTGFLTDAWDGSNQYTYGFDSGGLPSTIEENGTLRVMSRSGSTLSDGTTTYQLDELGRTVSRGNLSFVYGAHGHLARAQRGTDVWTFLYDESGQRLMKLKDAVPVAAYLEEGYLDATGFTEPVRVGGALVGLLRDGAFQMVATDTRGTVMAETDGTPRVASPFGNRQVHPALAAVVDYVQRGYDADLGTVRMGVRDYDPAINRFLTPDPLYLEVPERCVASPVDCNLYGYARNAPTSYIDPSGREPITLTAVLVGVAVGAAIGVGVHMVITPSDQWTFNSILGAAAGGAIQGTVAVFTAGASLGVQVGMGATGAVVAGTVQRGIATGSVSQTFDTQTMATEAVIAAVLPVVFKALGIGLNAMQSTKGTITVEAGEELTENAAKVGCFVAGTPVLTLQGSRPIEDVEVGDLVWAWDEETKVPGWHRVARTFTRPGQAVLRVVLLADDGRTETLDTTAEHPFWVDEKGWTPARELAPGDVLETAAGTPVRVQSLAMTGELATVYNLEVEEAHTFFVGTLGVWVHNKAMRYTGPGSVGGAASREFFDLDEAASAALGKEAEVIRTIGDIGPIKNPGVIEDLKQLGYNPSDFRAVQYEAATQFEKWIITVFEAEGGIYFGPHISSANF